MTDLRCRKRESSEEDSEDKERKDDPEVHNPRTFSYLAVLLPLLLACDSCAESLGNFI